jgi:2-methylisocitrate lyase-like PEP mutase family enzyme
VKVEIGDDHLTGTEAAAVNNVVGIHVDETGFGTRDNETRIVECETAGAQAIAVEDGSDLVTISECQGSRAIPRFDAIATVLQER